ncbi:MAG: ABC transporter ATP-binding protein [Thermoanaerobaculia bacterium]
MLKFEAKGLSKAFEGPPIFRNVSILAERGLVAVTGRNGSGKSTLVKIFAGLMRPTEGKVRILDEKGFVSAERRRILAGWASPEVEFPDELTAEENLLLLARAGGVARSARDVAGLLDAFGLDRPARSRRVGEFSSGMKQRVRLAYSLLFDPAILFWDEPFSNLDVEGIAAAREQMRIRRETGLVFLATNVRSEIENAEHEIALS